MVALYALDYVDGSLRSRLVNSSNVPGRLSEVAPITPVTRELAARPRSIRYWEIPAEMSPIAYDQLITAVPLRELRYTDVSERDGPEMPASSSPLSVRYLVLNADGSLQSECVLEPNLISTSRRLTTAGAQWISIHGTRFLLVGFLIGGDGEDPAFYRLYTEEMEIAFETPVLFSVDANTIVQPLLADLNGDGDQEVILFAPEGSGQPLVVLQSGADDGSAARTIGFSACGVRMNGPDVVALQRALVEAGFSVGRFGLDGWYGPDTRGAVIEYQKARGLAVTGVANEETLRSLGLAR
jgi:hypothetical protein